MGPGRYADCPGSPYIQVLSLEFSAIVEDLNPPVPAVAYVHVPRCVSSDRVRGVELAGRRPSRTPGLNEHAVLVELRDPGVAVAIGDENVSGGVPGHVGRPIEDIGR